MSNACYTQYRVVAPDGEIKRLVRELNKWGREGDPEDYDNLVKASHVPELTDENIKTYKTGVSVLSFETETRRTPSNTAWGEVICYFAPHACIYYYAEELHEGIAVTNDVWHRYFHFTYVIDAYFTDKTPDDVREIFSRDAVHRDRTDQYGWYTYLGPLFLEGALSHFVSPHRRYLNEMLAEFDDVATKLYWETDTCIEIHKVEFIEDDLTKSDPCDTCQQVHELYEELSDMREKINELEKENYDLRLELECFYKKMK